MKSWLVTVDKTITDAEAFRRLSAAGAEPDTDADVIPFDDAERAITVFATASVAASLSDLSWVCGVFPNSEMQPY
ncbi:MAG: hypothetical protein AAFR47_20130 [Pseudomonadota bacterium]